MRIATNRGMQCQAGPDFFRREQLVRSGNKLSELLAGASLLLSGIAAPALSAGSPAGRQPNIVLIYIDDIGYGDLECYGARAVKTPHVNRLASEGIRFTNAYACASTCTPSRYGMLTGEYPWRRDDTGIARGDAPMIIRKDQYTVASLMHDAGYTTAVVGKWHLGLGEGGFICQDWNGLITPGPKDLGFDYSYIMAATGDRTPCVFIENQRVVSLDPNDPIEASYTTPFEGEPLGGDHPELLKMHPSHGHDQATRYNKNTNTEPGHDTIPQLCRVSEHAGEKIKLAGKYPEKVEELSKLPDAVKRNSKSLAPTPPMGWNSWNWFGKRAVNEENMKQCMDAIVAQGLADAGYEYFIIDGGWRDTKLGPNGELLPHPEKFPHGIKALADYAHSLGLKFGLHTVPGTHDCGGDPVGGYGHEEVQVKQFVDWGLDFIKLDKCKYAGGWNEVVLKQTYEKWSELLKNSGRDIVLSISAYTWRDWYPEVGEMARTTGDIRARVTGGAVFDSNKPLSVMGISEENNKWAGFAGNGYWNDPDMLATGEQGLTPEEQKVHFALWCIMSSPLMLGNDPRVMSPEEKAIILNEQAIAVNQDPTEQGRRIKKEGTTEVWAKKLKGGRTAVLLLNRDSNRSQDVILSLTDLGISGNIKALDIWSGKQLGPFPKTISEKVDPLAGLFLLLN
ncbi:MAG: sulfatase-like hydrolase/transferase [Mangrovibacterium sp.]